MKKNVRGRPGTVPNEIHIIGTPGIRLDDISVGDRVSYIHPSGGGQHMGTVTDITQKGIIRTKDWVEDKLNIITDNVRSIWKLEAGKWIRQPLYISEED